MLAVNPIKTWGWAEMEQAIRCPICYEVPSSAIYQCTKGHHVCENCMKKVPRCPFCQSSFLGTRNFPLEDLISNIGYIQNKLLENNERAGIKNDGVSKDKTGLTKKHIPPAQNRGLFPCLECASRFPISRLLNHIRYSHNDILLEAKLKDDFFHQKMEIYHTMNNVVVKAIKVDRFGLFFLSLYLGDRGVIGFLQMAASHTEAQKFIYSLRLNVNDENVHFIGRARSCREPPKQITREKDCLMVAPDKYFFYRLISMPIIYFLSFLTIRRAAEA